MKIRHLAARADKIDRKAQIKKPPNLLGGFLHRISAAHVSMVQI